MYIFPPLFGLDLLLFDLIPKMLCHGLNQFNPTFAGALCRFASAALSLPLWRCARVQPASNMFELLQYVGNGGNGEWMFWCFYVCHFSWGRNAKVISLHALHICRHRRSLSPWLQRQLMHPQAEMQIHRLRLWRLWRLNVDWRSKDHKDHKDQRMYRTFCRSTGTPSRGPWPWCRSRSLGRAPRLPRQKAGA